MKKKKDMIIKYAKIGEPLLHILNSYLYHLSSKKGEKIGVGINDSDLFCLTYSVAKIP